MPELPEVENIARGLAEVIPGKKISAISLMRNDIVNCPQNEAVTKSEVENILSKIVGQKVSSVSRRAKRLLIGLSSGGAVLIQLGMTGRFVITEPQTPLEKHAHLIITLSSGKQLRFVDHRRFGRVWYFDQLDCNSPDSQMIAAGMGKLGPEPFDISQSDLFKLLSRSDRNIKTFLLDQTKLAGLGNIYADESLFASGIHPTRTTSEITKQESAKLLKSIKSILKKSISAGGTSFSDYRNAYGDMGNFLNMLKVYQRTGKPCKVCKTAIEKIVITGRSTHFCPKCQPVDIKKDQAV